MVCLHCLVYLFRHFTYTGQTVFSHFTLKRKRKKVSKTAEPAKVTASSEKIADPSEATASREKIAVPSKLIASSGKNADSYGL